MLCKQLIGAVGVAAILALTTPVLAADNGGGSLAPAESTEAVDHMVVDGTISSVDLEKHTFTLVLAEDQALRTFTINDETKYLVDGNEATAEDALILDAKAKVTYSGEIALKVEVITQTPSE